MTRLADLQASFCRSVTGDAEQALLDLIADDGFEPGARLSLYRNNVLTRLTTALGAAFPVVNQLVGAAFFDFAARRFLRSNLPTSGCLVEYGSGFPAFLQDFSPVAELLYLPDVARLEWAVHRMRRAATPEPLPIEDLGRMSGDPAGFRLQIAPAVSFLTSPHAVDRIWIAHQSDRPWDELRVDAAGVCLQISGVDGLQIVRLPPATWAFRARLAEGHGLGSAVARAMAASVAFDPPSALGSLFGEGLVVGLSSKSDGAGVSNGENDE